VIDVMLWLLDYDLHAWEALLDSSLTNNNSCYKKVETLDQLVLK
jgi:hypothetical protein